MERERLNVYASMELKTRRVICISYLSFPIQVLFSVYPAKISLYIREEASSQLL